MFFVFLRLLDACVSIKLTNPIFDLGAWGNTKNIIQVPRNFKYIPIRQRTNIYFVKVNYVFKLYQIKTHVFEVKITVQTLIFVENA